jgi:Zn finger protein HypA/HybF involved in hydrogenase expression
MKRKTPMWKVLRKNSGFSSSYIRKRLIDENYIKDECEICGWSTKYPGSNYSNCELDHINGNNTDNRLENVRLLCPNCHSQTDTYRGRNINTYKPLRVFKKIKLNKRFVKFTIKWGLVVGASWFLSGFIINLFK